MWHLIQYRELMIDLVELDAVTIADHERASITQAIWLRDGSLDYGM